MSVAQMALLEDFGTQGLTTPKQRLAEYKHQCRGLSTGLQAKFWLTVIAKDAEVAKLLELPGKRSRRRS